MLVGEVPPHLASATLGGPLPAGERRLAAAATISLFSPSGEKMPEGQMRGCHTAYDERILE